MPICHRKFARQRMLFAVGLVILVSGFAGAEDLPVTPAETLSGLKIEFPTALAGKPAVCVFGFSKEAGDKTKAWMAALAKDGINSWSIADLEDAPGMVRGIIKNSMRKGTPLDQLDHSLTITRDEKLWKQVTGAKKESLPVVVLLDANGAISWTHQGIFRDQPYAELKMKLAALPQP